VLNHSLGRLLSVMKSKRTLVPNGGQFHKRWIASTGVILFQAPLLSLVKPQRIRSVRLSRNHDDLLALKLLKSGKITPVIDRTYPLSQTPEAINYFGQGHARGKVAITV